MRDIKELRPKIEAKLNELMLAREWNLVNDGMFYQLYQKGDIKLRLGVEAIYPFQGSRYPDGYWIKIDYSPARRLKVKIDGDTFTIDDKKLGEKIDEVCAIIRERRALFAKREKDAIENDNKAEVFAIKIGELLPLYQVTPSNKNVARVALPGCSVFITSNDNETYSIVLDGALLSTGEELPLFIKTLAEFS